MKPLPTLAATLLVLTALLGGACGEPRTPDASQMERVVADASTRPGIVLVVARLTGDPAAQAKAAPRLVIDRVAVAPGAPPRLLDDPELTGRFELLDRAGEPLWSMGYRPARSPGETVRLRAPRVEGAVTVRLREPDRGLAVEAPIER
ncbi:MAG: hypothetical protein R3325_07400 [Thermoanaerobaculia bacterium]|nr:hypothetical protein [Thermoanaerobaculia bacterium]